MQEYNFFCDIFDEYLSKKTKDKLCHSMLNRVEIDAQKGSVVVYISTQTPMTAALIYNVQKSIMVAFAGQKVTVKNLLPKEAVNSDTILLFCEELAATGVVINGFLSNKPALIESDSVTLYCCNDSSLLTRQNLCEKLALLICEKTSWCPSVLLQHDDNGSVYLGSNKVNVSQTTTNNTDKKAGPAPPWETNTTGAATALAATQAPPSPKASKPMQKKKKNVKPFNIPFVEGLDVTAMEGEVLHGKIFKIKTLQRISDVGEQVGRMTIFGDVFDVELFESKKNNKILKVMIYDGTGSCKLRIMERLHEGIKLPNIKVGDTIFARGNCEYDEKWEKDYLVYPYDIVKVERKKKKDTAEIPRVELHLHTKLSSLDALIAPKELIKYVSKLGHKAVAITDHGNCQAFPQAMEAVDGLKRDGKDFKLIYGLEGYLLADEKTPQDTQESGGKSKSYHVILYAKTQKGLFNLYKIVSRSHLDHFHKRPNIPRWLLDKHREGLLVGSACEAGELYQRIIEGIPYSNLMEVASYYDYLEVQPIMNNEFMIRNAIVSDESVLKENVKTIVGLGERLNIPVIATGDVHFLKKEDAIFRAVLTSVKFKDADLQPPLYYRTTEEMLREFDFLPDDKAYEIVVTNPNNLANDVEELRAIPKGTYTPKIDGAEEELIALTMDGAKKIYGDPLPIDIEERLNRELTSINKHGFAVLYIIAQKLVKNSVDNGYLVGSRGSVGSSAVAFFAGISEVNSIPPHYICKDCYYYELTPQVNSGFDLPAKSCPNCGKQLYGDGHDIPFETFLGFNGDKAPDIDLNFSGEYQENAHKYTEELFGSEFVFKAGTISLLQDKTAFGYVKKYLEERNMIVSGAEEFRLSKGCVDVKKTTGQHPGGMVVVPSGYEVEHFTPVQHPADSKEKGVVTTHFEFKYLHDTILKLDILGHDMPTIFKRLQDLTGIAMSDVPMNDEDVMSLLVSPELLNVTEQDIDSKTGTFAIPELGTHFVRNMLITAQPKTFSDLIQISGLSHGTDVWMGNAKELIEDGICTIADVIGTRDSIMTELIKKGVDKSMAFKIMEWTRKGKAQANFTSEIESMLKRCNVEDWYIESCKKIKYMFPKAHAVAYLIAAVKFMWFKLYHPLAYYSVMFTVKAKEVFDYDSAAGGLDVTMRNYAALRRKIEIEKKAKDEELFTILQSIREMLKRGYEFLPIELHKSHATNYVIEDGKIRLPYISLSGLGIAAANDLYAACLRHDDFISVEEVAHEAKLSSTVAAKLVEIGTLSHLPQTSQVTLF